MLMDGVRLGRSGVDVQRGESETRLDPEALGVLHSGRLPGVVGGRGEGDNAWKEERRPT